MKKSDKRKKKYPIISLTEDHATITNVLHSGIELKIKASKKDWQHLFYLISHNHYETFYHETFENDFWQRFVQNIPSNSKARKCDYWIWFDSSS